MVANLELGHCAPHSFDDASELMPGHHGVIHLSRDALQVPRSHVQVAVAHPAVLHVDDHVVGAGRAPLKLLHAEVARAVVCGSEG
jgi:hypothetical protein